MSLPTPLPSREAGKQSDPSQSAGPAGLLSPHGTPAASVGSGTVDLPSWTASTSPASTPATHPLCSRHLCSTYLPTLAVSCLWKPTVVGETRFLRTELGQPQALLKEPIRPWWTPEGNSRHPLDASSGGGGGHGRGQAAAPEAAQQAWIKEGVGMELSLVRGLGEAGAKLAQTSCAGQRLPSVGASRGHRKDPPAFY